MKKSRYYLFNPALYRDMLRQLRLTGLVMAAICAVISIIPPVISILSRNALPAVGLSGMAPVLWGYMYVGGAGLIYAAFSYLNRRNGSDFYHSLPNTAFAAWSSAAAAAATWIAATVAGTLLVAYGAYWAAGARPALLYLPYLFGYFSIGTLLVAAAAAVAVCVTGTSLTNIVVTGLIVFLPRFFTTLLSVAIANITKIIPVESMGVVFNPLYNISAAPISGFVSLVSGGGRALPEFLPGYLYSAVLAGLYFTAAAFLYSWRKSETAGSGAASRLLQHLFRSVLIIPVLMIFPIQLLTDEYSSFSDNIALGVVLFFVSMILYFTYEMITTKKFKNLLTTLPLFLALVIAVPSVVYFTAKGASAAMLSVTPDKDGIRGVMVVDQGGDYYGQAPSYASLLASEVVHTSPELRELVAKALARSVAAVRDGSYQYDSSRMPVRVKIRRGLGSIERILLMTEAESSRYYELIAGNPDYIAALRESLPKDSEVYSVSFGSDYYGNRSQFFKTLGEKLWRSFKEETAALDGEALYGALRYDSRHPELTVSGYRGVSSYQSRYSLSFLTPNTLKLAAKELNAENGDFFKKLLENIAADGENIDLDWGSFSPGFAFAPGKTDPLELDLYDPEFLKAFVGLIKDVDLASFDGVSPYVSVSYYVHTVQEEGDRIVNYETRYGQVLIPLTDGLYDRLKTAHDEYLEERMKMTDPDKDFPEKGGPIATEAED